MIKLRISHYSRDYWVLQRKGFLGLWKNVTRTCYWTSWAPDRNHPVISFDKKELHRLGEKISNPDEMKKYKEQQDAIFKQAKESYRKKRSEKKKIEYI
jgi:hypothetical protein